MAIQRDKVIAAAEKLVAKGKIESAIREYERLLDDSPNDVNALNRIGDLWVRAERVHEAVKVFRKIATHYAEDGFFLKAIALYKKIQKLDPSDISIYAILADLYAKQGLAMEAKSQYQVLADFYVKNGNSAEALKIYRKIAELDPNSINVHVKLADLYVESDRPLDALPEYSRVGRFLLKRGMVDEALQVFRKAMKVGPADQELLQELAAALIAGNSFSDAIAILMPNYQQAPALTELMGRALVGSGEIASARDVLEKLVETYPVYAGGRRALADIYLRTDESDRALLVLRPLVDAELVAGDRAAALRVLQRILDIDVFHAPTRDLVTTIERDQRLIDNAALLSALTDRQRQTLLRQQPVSYLEQKLVPVDADRERARNAVEQVAEWIRTREPCLAVIVGRPGIGKSTLLQEIARRSEAERGGIVPLLITGRDVGEAATLQEVITRYCGEIFNANAVRDAIEHGDVALLLDGFDERRPFDTGLTLYRDILRIAGGSRAKVIITSRYFPAADAPPGDRFVELLPLDEEQVVDVLRSRLAEAEHETVTKSRDLMELGSNPLFLGLVCRVADEHRGMPAPLTISALYGWLISLEHAKSTLIVLRDIAVHLWNRDESAISNADAKRIARIAGSEVAEIVRSPLIRLEGDRRLSFVHQSILEWLVASQVAEEIRAGRDPGSPRTLMPRQMVEFLCWMAGADAARQWAVRVLARSSDAIETANVRAVVDYLDKTAGGDVVAASSSPVADGHEAGARELLATFMYAEAAHELQTARTIDPARAQRIEAEFGFLFRKDSAPERLRWCVDLWRTVTRGIERTARAVESPAVETIAPAAVAAPPVERREQGRQPQKIGEQLEEAALRLFRRFFALTENDEGQFRVELDKLRKQKAGAQFGYDLAFEALVAGSATVRCHVECKNYSSAIALKDVADKLLQQKSHGVQIDHWILISPHANPSADLHHFLEHESDARGFPFDIHVWSPETNVDQFFGLEPLLYDKFYRSPDEQAHPRDWSEEKKAAVVERYRRILRPVYRMPQGWHDYLANEKHLCFSANEQEDFERTYQASVPLGARDRNGVELPGTAIDRLTAWLAEPLKRVAFVLGEFGDGKSFLTYSLSRRLLQGFRASPADGVIPLRLALREFGAASNVREFLQARLELFGADTAGWAALKRDHKTLVILDGFDEISKELDPATITKNIRDLIECCNARIFERCKILITSRTHFFETGDAPRLLQRLDEPLLLYLSRIPRGQVLGHLQDAARGSKERELLQRLAAMHDPIGLGTKPLFLQMLKDTLHELPQDLDEVSVYESYARKSLHRKIELLDDPEFRSGREESIQQLLSGLGVIAEELQCSKTPYVSLKLLRDRTGSFAELLWRMTGEDRLESDAEARVGTRSLLSRVNAADGDGQWLVDFCHRSIREYFTARRFADCLRRGSDEATEFLVRVPVNHEILHFTACLLRRSPNDRAVQSLRELIDRSTVDDDAHGVGGRALTVLLRTTPTLPRDLPFAGRNFDYADLEDADISGLDFNRSTFKGANFANTNMEDADLSDCDLTGVRLHETTSVLAVAAPSAAQIFATYEDGSIWEWELAGGGKPESRIVFAQPGLKLTRLGITKSGLAWGIAEREALLFEMARAEWNCIARIPLSQTCADLHAADRILAVLFAGKTSLCSLVDLERRGLMLEVPMPESSVFCAPTPGLLCFRENDSAIRLVGSVDGRNIDSRIQTSNTTSIHAVAKTAGDLFVAVGESGGTVRAFRVGINDTSPDVQQIFDRAIHSAAVSSVVFADPHTIVSGGADRTIAVTDVGESASMSRRLQLSVRCKGLKTVGLRPEAQRKRLDALKARAAS